MACQTCRSVWSQPNQYSQVHLDEYGLRLLLGVEPKIAPNYPMFNRVFHYFHHPFWWFYPYFWKHPVVCGSTGNLTQKYLQATPMLNMMHATKGATCHKMELIKQQQRTMSKMFSKHLRKTKDDFPFLIFLFRSIIPPQDFCSETAGTQCRK